MAYLLHMSNNLLGTESTRNYSIFYSHVLYNDQIEIKFKKLRLPKEKEDKDTFF